LMDLVARSALRRLGMCSRWWHPYCLRDGGNLHNWGTLLWGSARLVSEIRKAWRRRVAYVLCHYDRADHASSQMAMLTCGNEVFCHFEVGRCAAEFQCELEGESRRGCLIFCFVVVQQRMSCNFARLEIGLFKTRDQSCSLLSWVRAQGWIRDTEILTSDVKLLSSTCDVLF
jgi:hypothetical protein